MTTYIIKQLRIQASEDQSGQNLLFRRGDRETKFSAVAALDEAGLSKIVIPLPTTNKDLMEGQDITTGKMLYLETDTEMLVRLDDVGDTGFVVTPVVAAESDTKPGMLYLEGEFAHVYVTPTGSTGDAKIIFAIAGA